MSDSPGNRSGGSFADPPRPPACPGTFTHGLRHSAATSALDAGRDLRDVRRLTRHRSLEMVLRYDERDVAGEIARVWPGDVTRDADYKALR